MQFPDKRFDWESVRVFLAIARAGTIRSAARDLGVGHTTIGRRLAELEEDLGVRLFEKLPNGLALTAAGEQALAHAERVESEMFDLERHVMGRDAEPAGQVRLTLPPPMAYGPLMHDIVAFGNLYPKIDVELVVSYAVSDMSRRNADIAVRFTDAPDDWLVGRRLPVFRDSVYATQDYIAANTFDGREATAKWIGWTGDSESPSWIRSTPFPDCSVRWRIGDVTAQAAAARAGLGMCLLPCWVGDLDPELKRVPPAEAFLSREAWILTHPDLRTSERVRLFQRYLVDAIVKHAAVFQGGIIEEAKPKNNRSQ